MVPAVGIDGWACGGVHGGACHVPDRRPTYSLGPALRGARARCLGTPPVPRASANVRAGPLLQPLPVDRSLVSEKKRIRQLRDEAFGQVMGLLTPGSLVDLGAGHGRYSRLAADLGWQVTAVDARTERWPDDDRVRWVRSDVRDADLSGYDVVLCLGVFYHLTLTDQLGLLERAAGRPVVFDTHLDHGTHQHRLSARVTTSDGYEGRFYQEPRALTASWGNTASFWPTLASFHRMLQDVGYTAVLTLEPWILGDRTFFLALPRR